MSGVHKSERGESKFEVLDHAVLLKNKIHELSILRNFGYKVRTSKTPRNFEQWSEKSWICARRDCLTYPQLRTIELTVLSIYGREVYEYVYDNSKQWRTAC